MLPTGAKSELAASSDMQGLAARRTARRVLAKRRRRRRRRRLIGVTIAIAWLALTTWSLLGARSAGDSATDAARALADDFSGADADELSEVVGDLDTAVDRLNDPWVYPLRLVPWIGRQVIVTDDLAVAARDAVTAGAVALRSVDDASLDEPAEALAVASTALGDALDSLQAIEVPDGRWLAAPVADARVELLDALKDVTAEVDRYEALASGLAELASGESTYLIAAANTSEMGSASGMLLQYGTMLIDDGAVVVSDFVHYSELGRPSQVPIDDGIQSLWFSLDPGHLWPYTSHLTSRASGVAQISQAMWTSDQSQSVDGVLVISPVAMQHLLLAAGVSEVTSRELTIPTTDLGEFFGRGQYELLDGLDELGRPFQDSDRRRELLAPIAASALRSIFASDADPRDLVDGLYEAFDSRHLMLYSSDPALQAKWLRAGAGGDPAPNAVKVAALNAGGNKLDYFLDISVEVETRPAGVSLVVTATNAAPSDAVSYMLGAGRPGWYSGHLVINVPAASLAVNSSGTTGLNASAGDGSTHSFVHIIDLTPGESAVWTVDIELPPAMTELVLEPSGRYPSISWSIDGVDRPDERQTFELVNDGA